MRAAEQAVARAVYVPRNIVVDDKRYLVPTLEGSEMFESMMEIATEPQINDIMGVLVSMGHVVPQQVWPQFL